MKNLYKILNIEQSATPDEVKKAYFEMAKKYHPDSGDEAEVKKFYEISEAYQILSNTEERRAYDLTISEGRIESDLIEDIVHRPKSEHEPKDEDEINLFRSKEAHTFRRTIFWQAILRVIGLSLLFAGIGYMLTLILSGIWYLGALAGFVIGLIWSVNRNFNVNSFLQSPTKRLFYFFFRWIFLVLSIGYFAFLILKEFG